MSNNLMNGYRVAVLTASDKGAAGQREDVSGKLIQKMVEEQGYVVASYKLLPDDRELLAAELRTLCDENIADLVLTTGGTGFSPRDCMPEATKSVAERDVPGIAEVMRAFSMTVTRRAMLSRAVAVIRGRTLIVNLPGSPKAVGESLGYILPELTHGLDILTERDAECAR